jgi:hypothetical protein
MSPALATTKVAAIARGLRATAGNDIASASHELRYLGVAMRRLLPGLLPLLLLAGCDGLGDAPPPSGVSAQLHVGFPRGGIADTIVVNAIDHLPLRAAELVAPDGTTTTASSLDINGSPHFANGQWVVGDPWQSARLGDAGPAALATQHIGASAALNSREQLLAVVSTADIPLPDPVVYKRDWANYRIRLTFGTPPSQVDTRIVPAPQPVAE